MRGPSYVAILGFACLSRLLARLSPVRLERLLTVAQQRTEEGGDASASLRIERVLERSEPLLRHTCLTRSLTRYYFLRRAGADVRIIFGVGQVNGRQEGHCWVLVDGALYGDDPNVVARFLPMWKIPGGAP